MDYKLKAYAIQDIGQRENQEDAFYPPFINPIHFAHTKREAAYIEGTPHTDDTLFILCDGMGGHERGEVASKTVCEVMSQYITRAEDEGRTFDRTMLHEATNAALDALTEKESPDTELKMGTTMTLLKVQDHGAIIAHIGDSRVYHFRPEHYRQKAKCLFRTTDHSFANLFHRTGNRKQDKALARVMMAYDKEHAKIDIHYARHILPGDVFFLCSDGILEELYEEDLCSILTNNDYTDEQRLDLLMTFCEGNRDNHTAWFVRVESCDGKTYCRPTHKEDETLRGRIWRRIKTWLSL